MKRIFVVDASKRAGDSGHEYCTEHRSMTTTTTLGDLITNVYATFERRYDAELAGVATAVTIDDLLRARRRQLRKSR